MDLKYVNPFINATINTIETMMGETPQRLAPYSKESSATQGDISGIIGFTNEVTSGWVAISLGTDSALKMYELMMGDVVDDLNADVCDCVGEIANIIAGNAKALFSDQDFTFQITIPTVIVGKKHSISQSSGTKVVVVPFKLKNDITFTLEISMKKM